MSRINESFRYFAILDGTSVTNEDVGGDPEYYGFTRPGGSWVIMRNNLTNGTFDFHLGNDFDRSLTNYDQAWLLRSSIFYKRAGELKHL